VFGLTAITDSGIISSSDSGGLHMLENIAPPTPRCTRNTMGPGRRRWGGVGNITLPAIAAEAAATRLHIKSELFAICNVAAL